MYNTDIPARAELPTSKQLLRSTFIAATVAVALLFTTVLPAEYGIDPTGIGRVIGLTEMGEIKTQLENEAEADRQKAPSPTPETKSRSSLLDSIFAVVLIKPAAAHEEGHGNRMGAENFLASEIKKPARAAGRTDKMSVTLKPGQGAEIKLRMKKGAKAHYSWSVDGGTANYDMHGDGPGRKSKSYKRGRSVAGDDGVLEASFNGNHGWFWRNRTRKNVTVKLWTNGEYADIKRVM
ncbi:MAG: transmembrane anchor protein [Rhodospirillaceae bacterium]|jgi:hypothetical protein|nr:transmembrane anchor protein [Rhodospirillaceae bacterium]MBT5455776.1 transmembrane anchor protein [Rhodospirillaceae bacterium]